MLDSSVESDDSSDVVSSFSSALSDVFGVRDTQELYFSGQIGFDEAINNLNVWRYFTLRGVWELPEDSGYVYSAVQKRGNDPYVRHLQKHPNIKPLVALSDRFPGLPLIFDAAGAPVSEDAVVGFAHFLKFTLSISNRFCSRDDWNRRECSKQVALFKKRLIALYGKDCCFCRGTEVTFEKNLGYYHVNLILFSPSHLFAVCKHTSKHRVTVSGAPVVTWRLGVGLLPDGSFDRAEKDALNRLWVPEAHRSVELDSDDLFSLANLDVRALFDCHDLIEYSVKYLLKFYDDPYTSRKRELTLSTLSLYGSRSLSVPPEFTKAVVSYCEGLASRLDLLESNCRKESAPGTSSADSAKLPFITLVTDRDLARGGFNADLLSNACFCCEVPPPNLVDSSVLPVSAPVFEMLPVLPDGLKRIREQSVLLDDPVALRAVVDRAVLSSFISVDTETTGLDSYSECLVSVSFAFDGGDFYHVPLAHNEGNMELAAILEELQRLFSSPATKFFYNARFDLAFLERFGFVVSEPVFDCHVAAYCVDSRVKRLGLKRASELILGLLVPDFEHSVGSGLFSERSPSEVFGYACSDAAVTLHLGMELQRRVLAAGVEEAFKRNMALLPVLTAIEAQGLRLDLVACKDLRDGLQDCLDDVLLAVSEVLGCSFNLQSSQQLAAVLYDDLELPVSYYTEKGVRSVKKSALRVLSGSCCLVDLVLVYREYVKLVQFLDSYLEKQLDGVLYSRFHVTRAVTGRLSCSDPNIQQLPKRSSVLIRSVFVPSPGNVFVTADYDQMELRMVAALSEDPNMCRVFNEGRDIHASTASSMFGVPVEQVTAEQRQAAKPVNFGMVYGMSAQGLAEKLRFDAPGADCSTVGAARYIKAYFEAYPVLERYLKSVRELAREQGFLLTRFGTVERFSSASFEVGSEVKRDERRAMNFVVQGACADVMKKAMVAVHGVLVSQGLRSRIVATIHDELVVDSPEDEVDVVSGILRCCMEEAVVLPVRLTVKVKVCSDLSGSAAVAAADSVRDDEVDDGDEVVPGYE